MENLKESPTDVTGASMHPIVHASNVERPILFSGPMVRAILQGVKTQTRRIMKVQPPDHAIEVFDWRAPHIAESVKASEGCYYNDMDGLHFLCKCPYGTVGDRLWVRETWMQFDEDHRIADTPYAYRASTSVEGEEIRTEYIGCGRKYQWRPSIHMPRKASRINLQIDAIRCERLNAISEDDAIAEGIESEPHRVLGRHYKLYGDLEKHNQWTVGPKWSYETLWEAINGPGSWAANPWVWVVQFRRV